MRISDWSSDVCSSDLQRRDGTQADGAQAVLQPLRAGAVLDAAESASGDVGAGVLALRRKVALPLDRTLEAAGHRLRRQWLQAAEAGGGEVARDAAHAQAIAARSEEHTSELQSLMRNTYAVYCFIHTH